MRLTGLLTEAALVLVLAGCSAGRQNAATLANTRTAERLERRLEAATFSLELTLAPLPNLLFQLDCLSGTALCAPAGYQALWKGLGLASDDEAALVRWKALRTRHSGTVLADAKLAAAPLLVAGTYFDLAERQRIAASRARSLEEFAASVALLSNDADARELRRIAERFELRFVRFWQRGMPGMSAYFEDMARLLGEPFLLQALQRMLRFYEHAAEGGETYRINLIIQPHTSDAGTTAFQLESDFLVEAPERGKAADVVDVVIHELCHALMSRMPTAAKLALVQAFVASEDPFALIDYAVLDEALATSFGNGLVYRHYRPDDDFARHTARGFRSQYKSAGALAAAFFPQLEALLASELTVTSPEALRAVADAARASYRAQGPLPIDYLHSHVLAAAPQLRAAAERVRDAAFAGFPYLHEFRDLDGAAQRYLAEHPLLSAAVYLPASADLDALLAPLGVPSSRIAELRGTAARSRGLVFALPRTPKSYLFVFLASDAESATELAESFIALRALREGVLIAQ